MKKYRIIVKSREGHVIFDHSSDSATKLIKRLLKESTSDDGTYAPFYFGSYQYYRNGEQIDDIYTSSGETYITIDGKDIRITDEETKNEQED